MFALLKLVGVPSETLTKLHIAINTAECKPEFGFVEFREGSKPKYITIESSKLEPVYGTYTITLKINWSLCCRCQYETGPWARNEFKFNAYFPATILANVLQAIDPYIMHGDEQYVATDAGSTERMAEYKASDYAKAHPVVMSS